MELKVSTLINRLFDQPEFADCFLLEVIFKPPKKIIVFVDSDSGITLKRCQKISRALEADLDLDNEIPKDYLLEVSSGGVERPLQILRQYPKHIGRMLQIELKDGTKQNGKLQEVKDEEITIAIEIKQKGKKKKSELIQLAFEEIEKCIVQISFK